MRPVFRGQQPREQRGVPGQRPGLRRKRVRIQGEGYTSKSGATNGIDSVKSNAASDARYERKTAVNGQFFFNLRAGNQEIIGKSEMYKSKRSRDHGISVIKRIAGPAPTEDTTS